MFFKNHRHKADKVNDIGLFAQQTMITKFAFALQESKEKNHFKNSIESESYSKLL